MSEIRLYELKEGLQEVRRLLVTMVMDRSGASITDLMPTLMETTRDIDNNIAGMLHEGADVKPEIRSAVLEIKEIWEAFRKTRDGEIIPALREGRYDDATKIASGIQEKRYREFISIAELVGLSQGLERAVSEQTLKIRENFFAFVGLFADLMELFDPSLGGHCKRVALLVKGLANKMGLPDKDAELIEAAANLHTIGHIGLPREIFHKKVKYLSDRERALLRRSPVLSQELLSSIDILKQAGLIIRSHMERYDGAGFPDGLRGEEIHFGARILAVCKLYETVMHREELPLQRLDAIALVRRKSGKALDPEVVNSFVEFMEGRTEDKFLQRVPLANIKSGMLLASDLTTARGMLLVPKGRRLSSEMLEKIKSIDKTDPIVSAAMVVYEH
ncbi:MAG: HD-GYP domain-containing protein [Thermodesulfobacteriota bacterium]